MLRPVRAPRSNTSSERTRLRPALAAAVALACLAAAPGAAVAAERKVPHGFFGAFWGSDIRYSPPETRAAEWDRMAASGVESVRTVFSWADAQPDGPAAVAWGETDPIVAEAARRRISLLPVVTYAPAWARPAPSHEGHPPRDPEDYARFLQLLVARYGPQGSFWAENPDVPRRPLREWQIWNEPDLSPNWSGEDFPPGYGRLLRTSYRALKRADRGSRVVLTGLVNNSWGALRRLYAGGKVKGYFDVAAVHPYTGHAGGVVYIVRQFKHVMSQNGDGRKPLYITEVSWSASRGKVEPPPTLNFIQTTDEILARRIADLYPRLARYRKRRGTAVARAYWYEWATSYSDRESVWDWVGLLRFDGAGTHAKPALGAYRRGARKLEGCAKTPRGECRR
jgi:hypothetical protein